MESIDVVRTVTAAVLLLTESAIDIKKKQINILLVISSMVIAVLTIIFNTDFLFSALLGLFEGLVIVILSLITKGALGMGDGLILCATGILLGYKDNFCLIFSGCVFAALFSIVLLMLGKADKKSRIPFVPFLLAGMLLVLMT